MTESKKEEFVAAETPTISIFQMIVMLNFAQLLYASMDTMQKDSFVFNGATIVDYAIIRSLVMLPVSFIMLKSNGLHLFRDVESWQWKYVIVRSLIGSCGLYLCNVAIMTIPLTAFNILLNLSPFFTLLLTYFYLNEKMTVFEMIAMVCSFGAVMLVALASPENSLSVSEESVFYGWTSQQRYTLGISCSVVSAFLFAIYITSARVLKELHYSVIFCWGMIFDSTVTLLLAISQMILSTTKDENPWPFHFTSNWPWLELPASAIMNVGASNLMTVSAQCKNPTLVQLLCYIKIVFSFLSDMIFF